MKKPPRSRVLSIAAGVMVTAATIAGREAGAQIPDVFTNLKVLPATIGKPELTSTMRAFANALGVRCTHCHAQADGKPPGELDWASDALAAKATARVMMQMTQLINSAELPKITTKHADRVGVTCRTCHHGQPRPYLIQDLLAAAYQAGGLDSLRTRYEALRRQYYGTDTYNFAESMLPMLADRAAGPQRPQDVLSIAEYNLRWFPQSGVAHLARGQAYASLGQKDAAAADFRKAIELDPAMKENAQRMLDRLASRP